MGIVNLNKHLKNNRDRMIEGKKCSNVILKTRQIGKWVDVSTEDIFKDKNLSVDFDLNSNKYLRAEFNKTTVSTKKVRELGWLINFDIKEGMKRTIESYL